MELSPPLSARMSGKSFTRCWDAAVSRSNIVFGAHYPNSIFIIRIGWGTYLGRGAFQPITFITRTLRIYMFNISRQSRRCSRSKKVLSVMARLPRLVIIPLAQSASLRESTKVSGSKATPGTHLTTWVRQSRLWRIRPDL
jgi:hypothetical protein